MKSIVSALVGFLLLILWSQIYSLGCYILIIAIVIGIIISFNVFELSFKRRYCTATCYFKEDSFVFRFFTRKIFLSIFSFIVSLILTLSLLLNVIKFNIQDIILYGFDIVILYYLYIFLLNRLNTSFNENMMYPMIKSWATYINLFIMVIILLTIQFNSVPPEYISVYLGDTIDNASKTIASKCDFINYLAKLNIEVEAIQWWFMLKTNNMIKNENFQLIAWIIFLINNSLVVIAFSKYTLQIIDFINRKKGDI